MTVLGRPDGTSSAAHLSEGLRVTPPWRAPSVSLHDWLRLLVQSGLPHTQLDIESTPASHFCTRSISLTRHAPPCLHLEPVRHPAQQRKQWLGPAGASTPEHWAEWAAGSLSARHAAGAWAPAGTAWMGPRGCRMAAGWRLAQMRPRPWPRRSGAPAGSGRTARRRRGSPATSLAPAVCQRPHPTCKTLLQKMSSDIADQPARQHVLYRCCLICAQGPDLWRHAPSCRIL